MQYNFDEIIDRSGTYSIKLDSLPHGCPPDALPVWVADMDFRCAKPITDALHKRVDRGIFGYTLYENEECKRAVTEWYRKRFDWIIPAGQILFSPGVVPAIGLLIEALTSPGDGIIVQQPVYYPFMKKIKAAGRRIVNNALILDKNGWHMDYDDLEKCFADADTAGMIVCSPHNPVGRVWTESELRRLAECAKKYGKWIVSDEIHGDLTRHGIVHTPLLKIAQDYSDHIAVCTAPSKTFNLAGMQFSNIMIPNQDWQDKWNFVAEDRFSLSICSPLGLEAVIAAYTEGSEWLDQVRSYIDGNISYVTQYLNTHLPEAVVSDCQGTYLMWVDFRKYCADPKELERSMQQTAKIAFDEGYIFGQEGAGFERLNTACPRSVLEECMKRLSFAAETLGWRQRS